MEYQQDHPDRLNARLRITKRNVSSLSDSSDRGSAISSASVSSAGRFNPSPSSIYSSKTNLAAEVTAEESSASRSHENGSSDSSSHLRDKKRSDDCTNNSSSPLIHVHKRRKKVNIESSSSEEKDESAEASSASSSTSDKGDSSSSSSLLYKRGTANSNIKTFVSLRNKQNKNKSSSHTSKHDVSITSFPRVKHHRKDLISRDQNDCASSSSSNDATISKLSSSSYSQSINSSSDTKTEAYASSYRRSPSGSSDQASNGQAKNTSDGSVEPYERSVQINNITESAVSSEGVVDGTTKTYIDSSASVSGSSDTSDPESSGSVSTSSSIKRKKKIVGSAMQEYQAASSSTTVAFDTCSISSTSTSSSTKRKKVMIGNALETYQNSHSTTTMDTNEESRVEKASGVVSDTTETNMGSFLSSSSSSSFTVPLEKRTQDETNTASTIADDAISNTTGNDVPLIYNSRPSSFSLNSNLNLESLASRIESCMYQDYSHITPQEIARTEMDRKDHPRGFLKKELPFPQKLHQILSSPDVQEFITWLSHGRAWKILNKEKFEDIVLPSHFRHRKFSSFTRQVNIWGFKRVPSGPDEKAYYHEFFLRGLPHISLKMRRRPSGKLQERMQSVYAQIQLTPDFYKISQEHPLPER